MAFMLQFLVAVFSLYLEFGKTVVQKLSNGARHIIDFSQEGVNFVFGPLANEWSFAINALPVIVFLSSLTAVLYHLKIMQIIVRLIGGALNKIIDSGKTAGTMCNLSNTNKFSKMGVKFFFAGTGEWMANGAKQFVDAGES